METRTRVWLCFGCLSQNSQESFPVSALVKVTRDLFGVKSNQAGQALAWVARSVSWAIRLAAAHLWIGRLKQWPASLEFLEGC